MKLNDLDCLQSQLVSLHQHQGYCWNCKHLADDVNAQGEFVCNHPIAKSVGYGETIDNLVCAWLTANALEEPEISDFGVGNYCALYRYDEYNVMEDEVCCDDDSGDVLGAIENVELCYQTY